MNSVAPGVILIGEPDERVRGMIQATPAGRGGGGEEIAGAVSFFLGASDFVTGQIVAVDGGLGDR